jgi:hypothetical protein
MSSAQLPLTSRSERYEPEKIGDCRKEFEPIRNGKK